jgi:hypothetical protein
MAPGGSNNQQQSDAELEGRINAVYDALLAAPTLEQKRCCAARMAELISQRSRERVAEMEREQGLRV